MSVAIGWFEALTGLTDDSPEHVRRHIHMRDGKMISTANGRSLSPGTLTIPALGTLREQAADLPKQGSLNLQQIVADVQELHRDPGNRGATFQVASQFNLLEMTSPDICPEDGIARYAYDPTQGPACAMACGAGTLYRNYFVPQNGVIGQNRATQIDTLSELGDAVGNHGQRYWAMTNGYALPTAQGLTEMATCAATEADSLADLIRVGVQSDTEVTLPNCGHTVTQVYASALPIAYSPLPQQAFEPFARLVLNAAYEATCYAAVLNALKTGNRRLFLTQLGGGAFGNRPDWIADAIERSLLKFAQSGLDIRIVSYGQSSQVITDLIERYSSPN